VWTRLSTAETRNCWGTFQELAADHLQVIAGDKGEANLGLDQQSWQRLADTVDLIVDSYTYVSTANVGDQIEPSAFTEDADIRVISPPAPSTAATSTATAPASGPARCCCARPTTCVGCRWRCFAAT
jgi:thioester reductase-like protein